MKKDTFKTKVVFLIDMPTDGVTPEIFAFFPNLQESGQNSFTSYAHIGQHSACNLDYANACNYATPEQYADLATELESIGYNLEIITNL